MTGKFKKVAKMSQSGDKFDKCPPETSLRQRKRLPESNKDAASHYNTIRSQTTYANLIKTVDIESGTFWLTRIVLLRGISFIYVVAFLVGLLQNKQLIGKNGLLPAPLYLDRIKSHTAQRNWRMFEMAPTVFWLFDYTKDCDVLLDAISWCGLLLSSCVLVTGCANVLIMFTLWVLYHSLVNVGQRWYSFGWESQLLESGFLSIFFCPLLRLQKIPEQSPPSFIVVMCYRWLIFRIMLGAGLIKIRGDKCWKDLTCMDYHYQTQPVPNPIAYWMHQEPAAMHTFETASNHVIELVLPWLLLMPRPLVAFSGAVQIFFQVVLIISGNLSFLNWLTIIPSLCCFDDRFYSVFFSHDVRARVAILQGRASDITRMGRSVFALLRSISLRSLVHVCLAVLIAVLSVPVVQNLFSDRQLMNTSFDSFRIVNTYGAFGSVTKQRTEVVLEGTHALDPSLSDTKWLEYEFHCKPGNVSRRPCLISPYHYRLDWLMWFAAFQNYKHNEWLIHLTGKFLINDPLATSLIAHNPFECTRPPRWIRAQHYRYKFAPIGSAAAKRGDWWIREPIGEYLPVVNLETLKDFMHHYNWVLPDATTIKSWSKPEHCLK